MPSGNLSQGRACDQDWGVESPLTRESEARLERRVRIENRSRRSVSISDHRCSVYRACAAVGSKGATHIRQIGMCTLPFTK